MKYKALLIGASIIGASILGDYCNIKDRIIEPLRYKKVQIDSKSYPKPFALEKRYKINDKGKLEVYIGYGNKWYKVNQDLRVNERSLKDMLEDEGKENYQKFKKWLENVLQNGNNH